MEDPLRPIRPSGQANMAVNNEKDGYQPGRKLEIGVSFFNLHCHGFSRTDQYQRTFIDFLFILPRFAESILNRNRRQQARIISDFEGLILPGQMLLVLGRPGSGCSTFLKSLAGDTRGFSIGYPAGINYQGIPYSQFHDSFKGERVYLAELDVHFPELTLGETLNFAVSTRQQGDDTEQGRDVAARFSLSKAFDTQVGDAIIRGISGGEKRRTSIAEAFIAGSQFQCWDNSTRGLDSSTASRFIRLLRETTQKRRSTVAMSLYQASDNMYRNFDLVTLLYEGRQIYFGPTELAVDYFVRLGFVKPSRDTAADFLTSLTNPAQHKVQDGYENRVPRLPEEFADIWKRSDEARQIRAQINAFNSAHPIDGAPSAGKSDTMSEKLSLRTSTYPLPLYQQAYVCIQRAYLRICRNIATDSSTVIANTILGLIIGSVFYNLGSTSDSLQPRSVLLFFALMLNAFAPAFEVVVMWAQRPIVEKQHRYAFYHPSTERFASLMCDLPTKVLVCLGIHLPIYFLVNLRRTVGAFFVYWLFMFVNLVTMSMLFRMIGSVSKTREQTTTPVSIIILLTIIYTGFIVPPDSMVPWLGWFWRINPLAYTYESLMINELRDRIFPCSVLVPAGPSFDHVDIRDKVCAEVGSKAGQQFIQGSDYLQLKYGFVSSHLWRNLGIIFSMMVAFLTVHLLAAQYVPAQPSRGEVLLFRRGKSPKDEPEDEKQDSVSRVESTFLGLKQDNPAGDSTSRCVEITDSVTYPSHSAALFYWNKLRYEVKDRTILQDVNGWVKPGTLTALMGVTGAGKTSLLNVLADRTATGTVSGNVFVDGHLRDSGFRRKVGYVQQEDIHLATTTVREALQFSALMRQPESTPKAEKLAYVESVLELMDMLGYAEAIVGVPGEGLNVEQRKRLTIAVEMVAKPDLLLFLDEPTSGLDSQTAWSICSLLRRLSDNGQAILCTIHQPSHQLFRMFDRILLLGEGGTTLYFGDIGNDASNLIEYFESNGAPRCPPGDNPAEWMLEVTGKENSSNTNHQGKAQSWPEVWHSSKQKQEVLDQLAIMQPSLGQREFLQSKSPDKEYAVSMLTQMALVLKRTFQDQWRDPVYLYCKITLSIGIALFNGISFYNAKLNIQGVISLLFSIFLVTSLFSSIVQLVVPNFNSRRAIFEARERNSNMYSWVVFIAANVIVELFWQTIIAVPVFAAWYYPVGLQHYGDSVISTAERGLLSFLLLWLFTLWSSTLSQAFAVGVEHAEIAMQLATLFYWLTLVFCGVLVSPSALPKFWIFMYRVSPLTYLLEGLAVTGLADAKISCSAIETLNIPLPTGLDNQTCGEYLTSYAESGGGYVLNPFDRSDCKYCVYSNVNSILTSFGMDTRHTWRNFGILSAYVVFNIGATFAIFWATRVPKRRRAAGL